MKKLPKISIIIPCKRIDSKTKKCIEECLNLNYKDFEILVLPDNYNKKKKYPKIVKVISTGKVKPAFKRNKGMKEAKGKFFGFIDSDAYPKKDWLKNVIKYFKDERIGIVGGPNLTPPESGFWEKVFGYTLANFFVTGKANIRYKIVENQYTHELPSCNYIAKKEASSKYDSNFLTAEDSEVCFNCKKRGYNILYAKDVIVYHHRRKNLKEHIKQIFIYGRDIAWLTKKDFSLNKIYYSILSLFVVLFFVGLISSLFSKVIGMIFILATGIYLFLILFTSIHENLKVSFNVFITSIITHFSYGIGWLYGVVKKCNPQKHL